MTWLAEEETVSSDLPAPVSPGDIAYQLLQGLPHSLACDVPSPSSKTATKLQATIPVSTAGESQLWRADPPGEALGFDTICLVQAVDLVWAPDYLPCPQESKPIWNNSWPTQPAPFR
ncbi:uncharacterized protein LOC129010674 [Pongo pygmaeus]|uniref:uncharacterized protein LOC129010674 n=1 Tax=Pongo pygmaeus TaxID=9600 RepID=UPI0023E174E0|nr:uncharacterized protein LOC129010674 [Pongo pygmaeus]